MAPALPTNDMAHISLDKKKLKATVRRVTDLLANRQYKALEQLTGGVRLSAADLVAAVEVYGQELVTLPKAALEQIRAEEHDAGGSWWTDVDLFTVEEGRSDLTLQLTLRDHAGEFYRVEIDDLHVL